MTRLLVVEDEHEIRSILVELLQEAGYDVIAAASGDDASVLLQTAPGFDALVTDIHMPGQLDGLALARLFRKQYPRKPHPIRHRQPGRTPPYGDLQRQGRRPPKAVLVSGSDSSAGFAARS